MSKTKAGSLGILLLLLTTQVAAAPASWEARLETILPNRIHELAFPAATVKVFSDGKGAYYATIPFVYTARSWNIILQEGKGAVTKNGTQHVLSLWITGADTKLKLSAIGPRGETESQFYKVVFPQWETLHAKPVVIWNRPYYLTVGLGISSISYQESNTANFSEIGLTAKAMFLYSFTGSRFDVAASSYFTVLPLYTSNGQQARFWGVNARGGLRLTQPTSAWSASVLLGGYYVTMFTNQQSFGFKDVFGPQIYPSLARKLGNGDSIGTYLKYSPIAYDLSLLTLTNREIAGGANWNHRLKNQHLLSIGLDVARIDLSLQDVQVQGTSISLGASYQF